MNKNGKHQEELPILRPLSDDKDSLILCPPEGESKIKQPEEILEKQDKSDNNKNDKNDKNRKILGQNSKLMTNLSAVESRLKIMMAGISVGVFESLQKEMLSCEEARGTGTFLFLFYFVKEKCIYFYFIYFY